LQGLIVAAGQGTRLRGIAPSKPLANVRGRPLIEHVITSAHEAGVGRFVVVTGYEGPRVEAFLRQLSTRTGIPIQTVRNPDWKLANGHSVAAASPVLEDRFVLLMSDHLFDPGLLGELLAAPAPDGSVVLAVDRRLDNPLVDLEDVTRVRTGPGGAISAIGKMIEPFDAYDTGVFLANGALIDSIREDIARGGSGGISGGMTALAERGLATTFDIGDRFWLDVDDQTAFDHAGLDWQQHVKFDERYLRPTEVDSLIGDATKASQLLGWNASVHTAELARIMVDADVAALESEGKPWIDTPMLAGWS
jgi:1L-myo-inositol 1-phosphate cytidylyltransferase